MIVFVTWVLWYTDGLASPLLNLYLLPVITSALTLGKFATLANVGADRRAATSSSAAMRWPRSLTLGFVAGFAAQLAPVLLVAYITTMFSADIRYGLQRAKLLAETDELTGPVQHARLRHRRQPPVRPGAALRPAGERADDRLRQPEGR